jgi:hypothetical protein
MAYSRGLPFFVTAQLEVKEGGSVTGRGRANESPPADVAPGGQVRHAARYRPAGREAWRR